MNLINNLPIRSKLLALTLLPLIGFISFAVDDFMQIHHDKVSLEKMLVLCNSAATSSFLVHELQKERGASAGYLSSKGTKFKDIMQKQRLLTDQKNQALQNFIASSPLSTHLEKVFSDINQELSKLQTIRKKIDDFSITAAEEVAFYTKLNAQLLTIIDITANDSTEPELSISAITISSFLQHKERAGIERAVLSNVFSVNKFSPSFLEKFIRLLAEQKAYLAMFTAHATQAQLAIYSKNLDENALKPVQDYRNIALKKMLVGGFNVDATAWFKTITEKINKLKVVETTLLQQLHKRNLTLIDKKATKLEVILVIIIVPLIIVILLSWYITKSLQNGVNEITHKLTTITKNSDLTLEVDVKSRDELGEIGSAINGLVSHLQNLVKEIQHSCSTLQKSLMENIESNRVIKGEINNGIGQVTQVVTATTEMNSTISDIARNAVDASSESKTANTQGEQTDITIRETVGNISLLSNELNSASLTVHKLNKSALNIGQFLNAVKDISDKTNLLALNAAIEAARAGDSGRGFAVVADEVRSLSMQTKTSTDEIEELIKTLQSDADSAELAMKNGINMVARSVEDAQRSGQGITEISACINQISGMNEQIATAAEEQSSVTEEINRNMIHIQDGYSDMQLSYQRLNNGCDLIEALADELEKSIAEFTIS